MSTRNDNETAAPTATVGDDLEMAPVPATPAVAAGPTAAVPPKPSDPLLVTFEQPYDPENPLDWRTGQKWAVTDVLSATGFNRIMVSTIMAPALPTIAHELGSM